MNLMTDRTDEPSSYRWLYALIALGVFANFAPLFVTIIGGDGTLYASIAKHMARQNDYVNMVAEGRDWLDKPHFPFWVTAIFFEVFGIHGWSYKLPAILFLMMGVWYTYLFANRFYNKQTALVAVVILLTAEHILLSSNDVRAEPYLTGLIIGAVYHLVLLRDKFYWRHLIAGSIFAACAVMTKGIFALLPVGGAIIGHLALTGSMRDLLKPRWFAAVFLIVLFITPELYCLWLQFDQHPAKIIFGQTHVSGLRFFFWDSQFGRFFNTGPIKGKGDPTFFIHTTLWAFLPWSILLFIAIGQRFRKFRHPGLEWYSFFAAMLTFLLFSLSRFQLPHYLNIVFPFFAVMTADYLIRNKSGVIARRIYKMQLTLLILIFLGAVALQVFYKPAASGWLLLMTGVAIVVALSPRNRQLVSRRIITLSAGGIVMINLYLFWILYPDLLKYQAGSEAAIIANSNYPGVPVVQYKQHSYPLEFYLDASATFIDTLTALDSIQRPFLLFTAELPDTATTVKKADTRLFPNFRISKLNIKFIDRNRRLKQLQWSKLELIR